MPSSSRDFAARFHQLAVLAVWCAGLGAILAAVLGLSSFAGPDYWFSDNMSFFLWQFLFAGVAGTVFAVLGLLFVRRFKVLFKVTLGLAAIATISLATLTGLRTVENTTPFAKPLTDAPPIKIVSINLEALFLGDPVLQAYLEETDPDVVVFQETIWNLQKWQWQRRGLPLGGANNGVYPPYRSVGQLGGLVVFSKFPVEHANSVVIPGVQMSGANVYRDADREVLSVTLQVDERPVHLVAVHPDSPRTQPRWHNKRAYFDEMDRVIAERLGQKTGPVVAIGDWNSSPWSARFHQSLIKNNMLTAYPSGIPQTTRYFYDYRLRWILGSPVDQVAVTPGVELVDVSLGPDIGSDHRPLVVTLQLSEAVKK